jgi:hypothetical protein
MSKLFAVLAGAACGWAALSLALPSANGDETDDLVQQSSFVFKGTVKQPGGSTLAAVPGGEETAVVTVDEILKAPERMKLLKGKDVTVRLKTAGSVEQGQQAVFYTNGWLYGEGLAVVEVGRSGDAAAAQTRTTVTKVQEQPLRDAIAASETVVVGTVTAVRDLAASRVVAAGQPGQERLTEHDPMLREAVVAVESVEKGQMERKEVVVLYASSRDIAWFESPKLEVGQEGVFLLHKNQIDDPQARQRLQGAPGAEDEAFTVLDPRDFQPRPRAEQLRRMIRGNP